MLAPLSLLVVAIITYSGSSVLVGISFFAVFGNRIDVRYNRIAFLVLFAIFALIDVYWVPSVSALDMTVTIGNPKIATALGLESPFRVNDILTFGWFDVAVWLVQTAIGYFVGMKIYSRKVRAA